MHPILYSHGNLTIYSWGAMLALAIVIITYLLNKRFLEEEINPDHLFNLILWCTIFGILGARLFYVFFYEWDYYSQHLLQIIWTEGGLSGLVWYGGFAGGLLAAGIYTWRQQLSFWRLADLFAPYLALAYAIVRIGCFLNGCCYGNVCELPWAVSFPVVDDLTRHPTQLYSSFLNIIIFMVLLYLYPRRKWNGEVFVSYLIMYSVYRFFVEFFRENLLLGPFLTIAQWISLGVFALGSFMLYIKAISKRS
jgi:phosphatidylglycerol:prolipoprotein diacylglycerol transferase